MGLAMWIATSHVVSVKDRLKHKQGMAGFLKDLAAGGRSYYGMVLAHLGVAMFVVGVTLVSNYGIESDVRMSPGDSAKIAGYTFKFGGVSDYPGPNYNAHRGRFEVSPGGSADRRAGAGEAHLLRADPANDRGGHRMGPDPRPLRLPWVNPLATATGALRLYYKPYVRWIWLGAPADGTGRHSSDHRSTLPHRPQARRPARPGGKYQDYRGGKLMGRYLRFLIPLAIFAVIAAFLFKGLDMNPAGDPLAADRQAGAGILPAEPARSRGHDQ